MRRGFTLIELLVVVAILAILMSILLPALGRAKSQARQVKCGANMREVARAIQVYAQENQDNHHAVWANYALRFKSGPIGGTYQLIPPYQVNTNGNLLRLGYWASLYDKILGVYVDPKWYGMAGYTNGTPALPGWEITRCPESRYTIQSFRRINGSGGAVLPHDPYTIYSSYCFNGVTPGFDGVPETWKGEQFRTFFKKQARGKTENLTLEETATYDRVPRRITEIKTPSDIIMFQDGSEVMLDGNGDTLTQLDQGDWNGERPDWLNEYFRHPVINGMWLEKEYKQFGLGRGSTRSANCVAAWTDGHVTPISLNKAMNKRQLLQGEVGSTRGRLVWYASRF